MLKNIFLLFLFTAIKANAGVEVGRAAVLLCNPALVGAIAVNAVVQNAEEIMCPVASVGRQVMDSLSYTVGGVDSCNSNPDGSYNVSCDEVVKADEDAFNASFDYSPDGNNAGYVNCNPIIAPQLLEMMQLQDMAKATADGLECNLSFIDSYIKNPGSAQGVELENRVKQAFSTIRPDLIAQLGVNADASGTANYYRTACTGGGGDGGRNSSSFCTSEEHLDRRAASQQAVQKSQTLIDSLIAAVPYGSEPQIKKLIQDLAVRPGVTPETFARQFRDKMKDVQETLRGASDELKASIVQVPTDSGGTVATYLNPNSCETASIEARFFGSPEYDKLLDLKNLSPRLRTIMKCRRERRGIGAQRVQVGLMAASVVTIGITGGASLAGLTLGVAARAALVAADLSLVAADSALVAGQIYDSCYQRDSAIPMGGQQCRPQDGLNMALSRTSNADCALNVLVTAIPGAFVGGSAIARIARNEGEEIVVTARRTGAAARAERTETRAAAEARARFDADQDRLTAARTRQPGVSEAPGAGRSPRATASAATPPPATRTVPNDSPTLAFVRANSDDEGIRLTPQQETELANESYARKIEMDSLLTADGAMDKFAVNQELNEFLDRGDLDGFFRIHTKFAGANERRIRELAAQITEERLVLARSKVNNDIDGLVRDRQATVQRQDCNGLNALNSTMAFHPGARCSVVTFKKDVDNYCSCGARGRLGTWAGPCAEMASDYLLADTLADRDALPGDSARGLQECKRLLIRAGTVVVHGGLKPTMSGHGGAAQIFLPTRRFAPRGADDSALTGVSANLDAIGISDAQIRNAPAIDVVAVAPLNPNPEVTALFNRGRECRQADGTCNPRTISDLVSEFDRFKRRNPSRVTSEQEEQFVQWTEWLRGCRKIALTEGSSFSAIDRTFPGCSR